jgi:limonene-1,2-epoxide hydrolase
MESFEKMNERFVTEFCNLFMQPDIEKIVALTTEDVVYHNMPWDPSYGHEAIRKLLGPFLNPCRCTKMEIHRTLSEADIVMNQRTETWEYEGVKVVLPVAGIFQVKDGRVACWQDYFNEETIWPLIKILYKFDPAAK